MTQDTDPVSVKLAPDALTLEWSDRVTSIPAGWLRASCKCAPCQSARLRGEQVAVEVGLSLVDASPVGHYAVQLSFSDGHDRGIYPWVYLRELDGRPIPTS